MIIDNRLTEVTTRRYGHGHIRVRCLGPADRRRRQRHADLDGLRRHRIPTPISTARARCKSAIVFGPGVVNGAVVDQLLARTSSSGTTAWYLPDKLGSVRDIVGTSGTVLDHIVYDSFGNIVTETNATNGDRFKFAGMQYDAVAVQYYDRARDYGAVLGRFTSLDPTAFASDDVNLYRYVGNGPLGATDPSGESQSEGQRPPVEVEVGQGSDGSPTMDGKVNQPPSRRPASNSAAQAAATEKQRDQLRSVMGQDRSVPHHPAVNVDRTDPKLRHPTNPGRLSEQRRRQNQRRPTRLRVGSGRHQSPTVEGIPVRTAISSLFLNGNRSTPPTRRPALLSRRLPKQSEQQ